MAKDEGLYDKNFLRTRIQATEARIEEVRKKLFTATTDQYEELARELRGLNIKLEARKRQLNPKKNCFDLPSNSIINKLIPNRYAN